ncbi:hypothetical protein BPOR_0446g00080 [Botrytis porri]|uniref:DNA repair exonuclease rad1 n=1 Tax=Botrytis porri TaxID=87229 RepID=A0A4Z1KRV5_9HELO|nr:hypothetical protein BPOR_0446g00080 [Botrytis porri]
MESSLHGVWESAVGNPFIPTVGKDSQFTLGFSLLCIGVLLSGLFGLNRSALTLPLLGLPASAAIAFGSVYMICASIFDKSSTNFSLSIFTMSTPPVHEEPAVPIFKAVSSSARQLFQLLNTIRFATNVQVQISTEGIRFAVEESRVMQGIVFLDKALFTTFNCTLPEPNPEDFEEEDASSNDLPAFQISLSALLETLQIFGAADATSRFSRPENEGYNSNIRPNRQNAFSNQALGMAGVCRFSYAGIGSSFSIILEEAGVTTTCNLNTYEPEDSEEIPFQRNEMQVKIITQARWLFDAIQELNNMTPTRLDILALPLKPYFSLSASGHLGSASVDFSKGRELLETFTVKERWSQSYRFDMVKAAGDAMRLASKVSVRGDEQGVLSLQFMVEVDGGGVSFVDFRFVPFIRGEEDEDDENSQEDEDDEFGEGGDDE